MSDKDRVSPIPEAPRTGPLTPYDGAPPPAPKWFDEAVAHTPSQHSVHVEGADVHYQRWGDPAKRGILLTHGNGAHAYWWDFIAPFLARDYHVVANTLSGMGDSGWREAYNFDFYAAEQIAVCEAAGLFDHAQPPIIIGHSFGGYVTTVTGAKYGERLGGVMMLDSPIIEVDDRKQRPPRDIKPTRIYPSLQKALSRFRLAPDQECENHFILDYIARKSLRRVEPEGWTWKFDPGIYQRFPYSDMAGILRQVTPRMVQMRGADSIVFPETLVEPMRSLVPAGTPFIDIPEARHHMMLDQPLAVVTMLRTALAIWTSGD